MNKIGFKIWNNKSITLALDSVKTSSVVASKIQPTPLAALRVKFKLFSLSALFIPGPEAMALESTVSGTIKLTNLDHIIPSLSFLKTSLVFGSIGSLSLTSGSLANNLLMILQ